MIYLRDVDRRRKGLDQIGKVVIAVSVVCAQRDGSAVLEHHGPAARNFTELFLALHAVGVLYVHIQRVVAILELQTQGGDVDSRDTIVEEDPDESERILEAVKAKSNVLEDCIVTGYCADCVEKYAHMNRDEFGRVLTASGQWVYPGSCVATDPDVIPTGSTVIIGDKTYIALDVGVMGNHVDILMTHEEAQTASVRYETVWWCEE